MPDIFPDGDGSFDTWVTQYQAYASGNYEALGFLAENITALGTAVSAWQTALTAHQTAQATARQRTLEKDAARQTLEEFLRAQIRKLNANPNLTDAQRAALGLTVPDPEPTPVGPPATRPVIQVSMSGRLQHTVGFMEEGIPARRAKPAGVRGAQVWCKVGEPPVDPDDFRFLAEDTRTPYVATFEAAESGKMAYYQLRWVNPRGEVGPWSEVVSAMITP
jgi:hypothetical protein